MTSKPSVLRYFYLALLSCCLCSCIGELDDEETEMAIPPWHMWGNSVPVQLIATPGFSTTISSQLVNVKYGRPETWTWLFWYQVIRCTGTGLPGTVVTRFNLTLGIGRTSVTLRDFVDVVDGPLLPGPHMRWYTTATGSGAEARIIADVPSQNIVLDVDSIITGAAPGTEVDISVGAMFAPKTHVRPEWLEGVFVPGEDEGK